MWLSKRKKELEQVTLAAITSVHLCETVSAIAYSMRSIGFADAVFISHEQPTGLPEGVRFVQVNELDSIDAYNYFVLFELHKYIQTEYVLIVQWDGFVVNPYMWQNLFLKYDYIGAPWPTELDFRDDEGQVCKVGNGGASLRSKQLLEAPSIFHMDWNHENEDTFLCCKNKHVLKENGIIIAPIEVAKFFSHERMMPEIQNIRPFMFHQWGGDNAQYPKFPIKGRDVIKKGLIKFMIWIGIWNLYQTHRYGKQVKTCKHK